MKIVVAIDGSASALHALETVLRLAGQWGGSHELALVNVQQPIVHADAFGITAGMDGPLLLQLGERDLAESWERVRASGLPASKRVLVGPAASCIADYAQELGADLVALGTKGRSNLASVLVGSVAHRLPQHCTCPVLLVPPPAGGH